MRLPPRVRSGGVAVTAILLAIALPEWLLSSLPTLAGIIGGGILTAFASWAVRRWGLPPAVREVLDALAPWVDEQIRLAATTPDPWDDIYLGIVGQVLARVRNLGVPTTPAVRTAVAKLVDARREKVAKAG